MQPLALLHAPVAWMLPGCRKEHRREGYFFFFAVFFLATFFAFFAFLAILPSVRSQ